MSGVGIFDDPEHEIFVAPPDPTARWDDDIENYDRENLTDAFGTGDYALEGRCGFVFHVSCWSLLEKVLHPATVPCARLYEVCQSIPRLDIFLSWGHNYGGLVASDAVHYFPWDVRERFLDPYDYDDESDTSEHLRAAAVDSYQDHMSRMARRSSSQGSDIVEDSSENDQDSSHNTDNLADEQFDNNELGTSEEIDYTNRSMRNSPGRSSRHTADGSIEAHMGPTTLDSLRSSEKDRGPEDGEDQVAEYDSSAMQEQCVVAEYHDDAPRPIRNFVGVGPSIAGVIPRSSPSDSGSDYFRSDDTDHMPRLQSAVPTSDPYNVPEVQKLLMEDPLLPPVTPLYHSAFAGDLFARLPEEIRTAIASCLVTSDALSLRTASRSFWHIFYSQQFWKSRFSLLHSDRSWLFEALDGDGIRDWRYLYRRTSDLSFSAALQNRKRIWPLAIGIRSILCQDDLENSESYDMATSGHTNPQNTENPKSIEVAGMVESQPAPSQLVRGCRITRRQRLTLSEPGKLSHIAFSLVLVGNTKYISGLRFVASKTSHQIGYRSPREHLLLLDSRLKGWRIAVGARGIQGIQCVLDDMEADSPWFGSVEDACITDRLADCDIRNVDFGLDVSFIFF